MPSPRRVEQQTALRHDVLRAARAQLDAGGPSALNWRAIARAVGVGPSTLYTYFDNLDGLYTALIVDAYEDLAAAVRGAIDDGTDPSTRIRAGSAAYRRWALDNRARFNLVFIDVIPGYEAPADGPTVAAQVAVLAPLAEAMAERLGLDTADISRWPQTHRHLALGFWGAIHGLVLLEVNHHLDWIDGTGDLFADRVEAELGAMPFDSKVTQPGEGKELASG